MFALEDNGSAICSQLDRGTFDWNEETNIEPCSFSEFSAWFRPEPVSLSISLSPPHYTAAVAAIKIIKLRFLMAKWSYFVWFILLI